MRQSSIALKVLPVPLGVVLLALWTAMLLNRRLLSADGAYYLWQLADTHSFVVVGWTRQFAQYLTQWPAVLISYLPGRPLWVLEAFYSFGIWLVAASSFVLTWRWARSHPELLILQAISFLIVDVNAAAVIMGEHHVLAMLVWPALAFALFPSEKHLDRGLFLAICAAMTMMYEGAVVVLLPVAAATIWRMVRGGKEERGLWAHATALLSVGVGIALLGIVIPRDPANAAGFLSTAPDALNAYVLSCLFATVVILAAALTGQSWLAWIGAVGAAVAIVVAEYVWPRSAAEQFLGRTFTVTVLPVLLVAAAAWSRWGRGAERVVAPAMVFVLGAVAAAGISEVHWNNHLREYREVVAKRHGFLPVAETKFRDAPLSWGWTHPILSVLLSPNCVRTIVLVEPGNLSTHDPRSTRILSEYRSYTRALGGKGCGRR